MPKASNRGFDCSNLSSIPFAEVFPYTEAKYLKNDIGAIIIIIMVIIIIIIMVIVIIIIMVITLVVQTYIKFVKSSNS